MNEDEVFKILQKQNFMSKFSMQIDKYYSNHKLKSQKKFWFLKIKEINYSRSVFRPYMQKKLIFN